ncbi:hypothetical protein [Acutalibacter sp. 1XD8-36]|nr:hypothetical protein [Acutalibacter sp. 1XD8-36]
MSIELIAQKAMAFDLTQVVESQPDKTYTAEEVKQLLVSYIKGLEQ